MMGFVVPLGVGLGSGERVPSWLTSNPLSEYWVHAETQGLSALPTMPHPQLCPRHSHVVCLPICRDPLQRGPGQFRDGWGHWKCKGTG